MIYFLILFLTSTSCFGAQQPKTPLQKLAAKSSMPTPKYPSQYTISYTTKKRPYTAKEIFKLIELEGERAKNKKIYHGYNHLLNETYEYKFKIEEYLQILDIDKDKLSPYDMDGNKKLIAHQYRKLAIVKHPDKGGNSEEFTQISNAHETLVQDDATRQDYYRLDANNSMHADEHQEKKSQDASQKVDQSSLARYFTIPAEITLGNRQLGKLVSDIKQSEKDIHEIKQKTNFIAANVQQKSQLPYQGKKDESSFLYKLLTWSEKHKLEKRIALQKAVLQKHINFILHIPTLEEYSQYLDSQKLTFLDKMMQKNEFIRQQATLHRAKKIMLENPEIIFESSYENIEDKIQDVFNMIVEDIRRQR
jgi:hypothetical protein